MAVVIFQIMQPRASGPIEFLDSTHSEVGAGEERDEINRVVFKMVGPRPEPAYSDKTMKITSITTAVLESNFDWTIVKVETDENITGYGEAFLGPGLPAVIEEFAAILIGEDPTSIDRIVRRMRLSSIHASPGVVQHAFCGIETALLDVIGKRYRIPIWQILGGKYREAVTIYADCHAGDALSSINCLLVPRTPHWMATSEPAEKSVVSLKHHGWDASKEDHLTADSYAARAQEMVKRGLLDAQVRRGCADAV
jgi:L-alanine-DL-glutamate epimerase and related enzymes of enolase superfamily